MFIRPAFRRADIDLRSVFLPRTNFLTIGTLDFLEVQPAQRVKRKDVGGLIILGSKVHSEFEGELFTIFWCRGLLAMVEELHGRIFLEFFRDREDRSAHNDFGAG